MVRTVIRPVIVGGVLILLSGMTARADVRQVRLGVKGATCATCAFALRKAFKRLDNVAEAKLTTKLAVMEIRMKPGTWPNLARMREMIKDTGFESSADQVQLVLSGTLVKQDTELMLELDGMKMPANVVVAAAEAAPGKGVDLDAHVGKRVELEGTWKVSKDEPGKLGSLTVKVLRPVRAASAG